MSTAATAPSFTDLLLREDHLAGMATRDLLLVYGIRMFHHLGVNGTGVGQILKATRKSKSQFYHYFQDKDDFICAILRLEMDIMLRMASRHQLVRVEDFERWFEPYIELGELPNQLGCPVGAIASELSPSHPSVRREASQQLLRWEAYLAGCLEEMSRSEGFATAFDAKLMAQRLAGAIQGALLMGRATQDLRYIRAVRDDFRERLLQLRATARS
jgi:AcrR family transcriptional regulator